MDHLGHVALTDFGLSKENVTDAVGSALATINCLLILCDRSLHHNSPHSVVPRNILPLSSLRARNMVPQLTGGHSGSYSTK